MNAPCGVPTNTIEQEARMPTFTLTSPEFTDHGELAKAHEYNDFGGSGDNRSPELIWSGAPEGTRSFAVTLYDPDAPTGSGFWHWVAFDIAPTEHTLPRNAGLTGGAELPAGAIQSANDYGFQGFGGACPPPGAGAHRYVFTLHALSVDKLGIDAATTNAVARFLIHANSIGSASITARYER
ncbi:Raf kinase inhibitor-like protein, YbhB/YbcL family [Burkholderia sp. Ch1-1]|nr:Raf kinase inhibitor-like protein, YbhB/YbcL family [Burkholderia sp. Ch1-1]